MFYLPKDEVLKKVTHNKTPASSSMAGRMVCAIEV